VLVRVAHWMTHVEHDLRSPIWRPWLDRLGRELEVVRYDERGCGPSGSDDVPLELDTAVEELAAVVAACGAPRVALLGQSRAAASAVAYAVRHPERVSHLVLLGGYLAGLLHRSPSPEALAFHDASLRLVELGWGRNDPAVQQFFTTRFIPDASLDEARALNEQQRLSCGAARAVQIMRARAALDIRLLAPLVRCPTLVLHAEGDQIVPVGLGRGCVKTPFPCSFSLRRVGRHIEHREPVCRGSSKDRIGARSHCCRSRWTSLLPTTTRSEWSMSLLTNSIWSCWGLKARHPH
jgi:pimeloyl-ACP methyl ester carboxylesterase